MPLLNLNVCDVQPLVETEQKGMSTKMRYTIELVWGYYSVVKKNRSEYVGQILMLTSYPNDN